jgi:hypothetical protein
MPVKIKTKTRASLNDVLFFLIKANENKMSIRYNTIVAAIVKDKPLHNENGIESMRTMK